MRTPDPTPFPRRPLRALTLAAAPLVLAVTVLAASPAAAATRVTLANGDVLTGDLVDEGPARLVLEHPVLGRVALARDRVKAVEDEPPAPARPPLARLQRWLGGSERWDRSFELGASGSEGNTQVSDVVAGVRLESADDARRWTIDARYFHGTADDETVKSQGRARVLRDWLFAGHRWFAFGEALYDHDRFEAWEHRLSVGAGPGYDWLDGPEWTLRTRGGLFLTRTFGSPGRDELDPEAGLGVQVGWKPGERSEVRVINRLRASLREPGELRNLTTAAWKIRLTDGVDEGLAFQLGLENEWESDTEADEKPNDLTYYGSLVLDF